MKCGGAVNCNKNLFETINHNKVFKDCRKYFLLHGPFHNYFADAMPLRLFNMKLIAAGMNGSSLLFGWNIAQVFNQITG